MIKRATFTLSTLLCLFAMCQVGTAQANPWNGAWKADPATFHFNGPTFTIKVDADGYTTVRSGKALPKVICDAKPHATPDKTMLTCTKDTKGYNLSESKDGKPTRTTSITVSADGKTRTSISKMTPSDGAPFTMSNVAERVSGGPGMAGDWKEVKFDSSQDKGILNIAVKGSTIDFQETDSPKPINCKLDGTETKFPDGGTMSVKLADPNTLHVTYKDEKGVLRRENTFALSSDKKTITETDITPAPAPSKMTLVLHKM